MTNNRVNPRLAIFGDKPTFAEPLHVGRPNVGNREQLLDRINRILDNRWFTNDGPLVREFEQKIADFVGVKHCVSMCNATIALEIAIRALNLTGEVIVPSFTFVATAHALQWQGITPVFVDINDSHNIDPSAIERAITNKTSGIVGVHIWGRPCAINAISEIAHAHALKVLYDAAHAFGCSHHGQMIGGFGSCEVFSFHATKFLNSFEGGAVVTNDDELAEKMRLMRNFGFAGYDRVIYIGTNGKLTEACAAMGLSSLDVVEDLIKTNKGNYQNYRNGLQQIPGISLLEYDSNERANYQYIALEVDPMVASLTRDELIAVLHAENVLARRYFWPGCHRMEPYRTTQPNAGQRLTETERIAARVLVLPTGSAVTSTDIEAISAIISQSIEHGREVRERLMSDA